MEQLRSVLDIPENKLQEITNKIRKGHIAALADEKEAAPFLFYMMGDGFEEISRKVSLPVDIILATAIKFKWAEKAGNIRNLMQNNDSDVVVKAVQKDLLQQILVTTKFVIQKQLADVLSGKKKSRSCSLIPSSLTGLKQLIEMLNIVSLQQTQAASTVINGTNIQINNSEKFKGYNDDDLVKMLNKE